MKTPDFGELRASMVNEQIIARGIIDQKVIDAFRNVPRERFVPAEFADIAYSDCPLPIGEAQTISQPYMVAIMTELLGLKGGERVLEIGAGSGYQAAILAEIAGEVYSVERLKNLAEHAKQVLRELGYDNFAIRTGDGTLGWEEHSPYDGIIVTAGSPGVPDSLVRQLKDGGRLVIPVGGEYAQVLTVVTKKGSFVEKKQICGCVFVPLVGKEGWSEA